MVPVFKKGRSVRNYSLYANHAWYVPGVKGMFGLFAWFLVGTLLGGLVTMIFGLFMPPQAVKDYGMLIAYPLSFMPAMIHVANRSQRNSLFETGYQLSSSHFGPFKGWVVAIVTVLFTLSVMILADLPNYWNYKLTTSVPALKSAYETFLELMGTMIGGPLWSSFLLAAVFAPIFEEWLCRGMVLRGLLTKMKPFWAIVVSALFFALIHMNPWQALNAFIAGLALGYVYYRTGSLWLTMLIHFVNNATSVLLAQFSTLESTDYWIEVIPGNYYVLLYAAAVIVFMACIRLYRKIPLEQERGNIDTVTLTID